MGPFIAAWAIGEGIIGWRAFKTTGLPPVPGALLASSGLFAGLAVIAEFESARTFATVLAFGFDLAALVNLVPPVTSGTGAASKAAPTGPAANEGGKP
jgi:hypothetical protein